MQIQNTPSKARICPRRPGGGPPSGEGWPGTEEAAGVGLDIPQLYPKPKPDTYPRGHTHLPETHMTLPLILGLLLMVLFPFAVAVAIATEGQ